MEFRIIKQTMKKRSIRKKDWGTQQYLGQGPFTAFIVILRNIYIFDVYI